MPIGPVKFLLVDDLEENLLALRALLQRDGLEILTARSGPAALELLLVHDVALAVVDVQMPEMDGFDLAELMRGTDRTRRVPIIFLTAGEIDRQRRFRGYEAGAVDFLFKPVEAHVLQSKADVFFELYRQRAEVARQRDELRAAAEENAALLDETRRAREQAEAANRAKDRFLAVLSHELRTPLAPVLMTVSSLERDPALAAELREAMALVRRNVEVEARLIDDLLDLSRVLNGKLRLTRTSVSLSTTIGHALETCAEEIASKQLAIDTRFEARPDQVPGDAARLQQVFWNLLQNAIKFTPAQGRIEIVSQAVDSSICVTVRDTGIGIEPEAVARIFQPFEQADAEITRAYGGLGLGLAICKGIVEMHRGSITASSEGRGKGAAFTVRLPLRLATGATEKPAPAAGDGPATRSPTALRLLLVEDHADTARVLSRTLRLQGHTVEVAPTVQAGLALADTKLFDMVVSDLGLPDASGYEFMREVRSRHGLPGIAMSGYGTEEDVRRSQEAGFAEHLTKPVNVLQLEEAIRRVADARR